MDTYEDAVKYFDSLGKYGTHPGVENASRLLDMLGHPEEALKCVHVAGTNGKGSVCAFLADILTANGYRTGLFISPHLVDIRERIQIDRQMIDRDSFTSSFFRVQQAVTALAAEGYTGITYFDYLFAIAMCYFAEQNVDFAIVETGLGGRLDSTNAIAHPLLTVITSISHDHTEVLGDTLAKIASEKSGIIKANIPLIYCADEPEVCDVLQRAAGNACADCMGISRRDCRLISSQDGKICYDFTPDAAMFHPAADGSVKQAAGSRFFSAFLSHPQRLTVNSPATYQMENGAIAFTAALYLLSANSENGQAASAPDLSLCREALGSSQWEGRLEQIAPDMYLDGAHNADGIRMLLDSMKLIAGGCPVTLIFTAVKEKDTSEMIREICESGLFHRYLLTTITGPRALSPEVLREQFALHTTDEIITYETPEAAWHDYCSRLRPQKHDVLLIAGSLYLVGMVKELLS